MHLISTLSLQAGHTSTKMWNVLNPQSMHTKQGVACFHNFTSNHGTSKQHWWRHPQRSLSQEMLWQSRPIYKKSSINRNYQSNRCLHLSPYKPGIPEISEWFQTHQQQTRIVELSNTNPQVLKTKFDIISECDVPNLLQTQFRVRKH
jgi:hypothetical protein